VPSAIAWCTVPTNHRAALALVVPPKASFWLLSTPGILVASVVLKDEVVAGHIPAEARVPIVYDDVVGGHAESGHDPAETSRAPLDGPCFWTR